MENQTFQSTFEKRYELINFVLDSDFIGSTEDWCEQRNLKLSDLTDQQIDDLISEELWRRASE